MFKFGIALEKICSIFFITALVLAVFPHSAQNALARTSLATLQTEADALARLVDEAARDRAHQLGDHLFHGQISGILETAEFEDCLINENGSNCKPGRAILLGLAPNDWIEIRAEHVDLWNINGQPTEVESYTELGLVHVPGQGGRSGRIDIHAHKHIFFGSGEDYYHDCGVSPEDPAHKVEHPGGVSFSARLVGPSHLVLLMNWESLDVINTESIGAINGVDCAVDQDTGENAVCEVGITNYGDLKANYIVSLSGFSDGQAGPPAQTMTLESRDAHVFSFNIHRPGGAAGLSFMVKLETPTGRFFHQAPGNTPSAAPALASGSRRPRGSR